MDLSRAERVAVAPESQRRWPASRRRIVAETGPAPALGPRKRLAVFVSGGGSNLRALHAGTLDGRIHGDIHVVVSDKPSCGGCDFARAHGIPALTFPAGAGEAASDVGAVTSPELLVAALRGLHAVDLVLLAGYLKLLPATVCGAYPRAVFNIHPALLPAFGGRGMYGAAVHRAVLASGARVTGPTVHAVDESYDRGKIVAQVAVPVLPGDSAEDIAHRVLAQEHILYPHVAAALCAGRVSWRQDGVPVMHGEPPPGAWGAIVAGTGRAGGRDAAEY